MARAPAEPLRNAAGLCPSCRPCPRPSAALRSTGGLPSLGPSKMPASIVERLEREISAVLKRPDIQDQFNRIGFEMEGPSRQELAAFVKEQIAAWAAAARDAGIQPQ